MVSSQPSKHIANFELVTGLLPHKNDKISIKNFYVLSAIFEWAFPSHKACPSNCISAASLKLLETSFKL